MSDGGHGLVDISEATDHSLVVGTTWSEMVVQTTCGLLSFSKLLVFLCWSGVLLQSSVGDCASIPPFIMP